MEDDKLPKCTLQINAEYPFISDCLTSLIQTILYHRQLGMVNLNYKECKNLNFTYMRYTEDDEAIMKRIDEITQSMKRDKVKDVDVVLTLFKNVETRNLFFGTTVTKRKVEIWRISVVIAGDPVNIYNENLKKVPEMRVQQVEDDLRDQVFKVVEFANSRLDHLSGYGPTDKNPTFEYEVKTIMQETVIQSSLFPLSLHIR
eukprot:TRINITY_DN5648_c0_g1_i2.p4 TRINITY_DN5648_c0_g1~~TRINITY_DN5648_c0_g1_i2.p4  ORF type:complete len:201 (-),score=33.33 TRINITY_DN5648_c0_g1_i2:379-981(-)